MTGSRLFPSLLLLGLLGLAGCASHPVPLYQLDAGRVAGSAEGKGPAVLLGPVELADYLRQDSLLQRQSDGSLLPAHNGRWASRFDAGVDDVLLRRLGAALDSQRIALAPAQGFEPQVQVELKITRLDSGPAQPAVLDAQWRLLDASGVIRESRVISLNAPHDGSLADQVKAQGVLLGQLAERMADAIKPLSRQLASRKPTPRNEQAQAAKPKPAEPSPAIPMAEPIRTDVEVFRF